MQIQEPDVYVGLDEFEKDGTFAVTLVFARSDAYQGFVEDWQQLRADVRDVLLRDYPKAARDTDLQDGALPEIHAEPMFTSGGIYRKYPRGKEPLDDKKYYLVQHAWLERGLQIIRHWGLRFRSGFLYFQENNYNMLPLDVKRLVGYPFLELFRMFAERHPQHQHVYNSRRLETLVSDAYFHHIAAALTAVEDHFREQGEYGLLFCDTRGEHGRRFMNTDAFDTLRGRGHFLHLANPKFANSNEKDLLQACDLIGYVVGQLHWATENNQVVRNSTLARWSVDYLENMQHTELQDLQEVRNPAVATALRFVIAAETCIPDPTLRAEFKNLTQKSLKDRFGL